MSSKVNLTMDQGSNFEEVFNIADASGSIDLSTYTAASQMRKHYTSLTAIDLEASLSANGQLTLYLGSGETANIEPGRYLYDIEIINSSNSVTRVVEGIMTVTPNITRT